MACCCVVGRSHYAWVCTSVPLLWALFAAFVAVLLRTLRSTVGALYASPCYYGCGAGCRQAPPRVVSSPVADRIAHFRCRAWRTSYRAAAVQPPLDPLRESRRQMTPGVWLTSVALASRQAPSLGRWGLRCSCPIGCACPSCMCPMCRFPPGPLLCAELCCDTSLLGCVVLCCADGLTCRDGFPT